MDDKEQVEDPIEAVDPLPKEAREIIEKAKADGFVPHIVPINNLLFIYRPISRKEWKDFTRQQNAELVSHRDPETGDVDPIALNDIKDRYTEMIVQKCVLWSQLPVDDNLGAGYVETLSDAIMIDSGFGQPDGPSREA